MIRYILKGQLYFWVAPSLWLMRIGSEEQHGPSNHGTVNRWQENMGPARESRSRSFNVLRLPAYQLVTVLLNDPEDELQVFLLRSPF